MTRSGRKVSTVAALLVLPTITQLSLSSPSNAQSERGVPLSPKAPFPTLHSLEQPSPSLPMPEVGTVPGLPIPQLLLSWPWLSRISPSSKPSTAPPAGIGGQFKSNCTACSPRQMPRTIAP
jgi:hypothetical protein